MSMMPLIFNFVENIFGVLFGGHRFAGRWICFYLSAHATLADDKVVRQKLAWNLSKCAKRRVIIVYFANLFTAEWMFVCFKWNQCIEMNIQSKKKTEKIH